MRAQVFVGVVGLKRDDLQPPPFARFALQDRRGPLTLQAAADEVTNRLQFAALHMSAFGTKQTCQSCHSMSAFGGKADI